jgi:DNA-binding NarL/FixJ family response regulator
VVLAPLPLTVAIAEGRAVAADEVAVLVVDDQESFRDAVADLVAITPGFRLAGAVASGEAALVHVGEVDTDLVLLDVNLGGMSGVETCRELRSGAGGPAVVLMSGYRRAELPVEVDALAVPFVAKEQLSPEILQRLWDGLAGERRSAR